MVKKLTFFFLPLALILSHIYRKTSFWRKTRDELKQMEVTIQRLEEENREMEKKREYYQTEGFVYREAREKLGMVKEKDLIFMIPEIPDLSALQKRGERYDHLAIWQQWQELFFGKEN